jgi:hypothetical protein
MKKLAIVVALVAVAAAAAFVATRGGGGLDAPRAPKTYTLFWNAQKEPAGGIVVTGQIPSSWKEKLDAMGSPEFEVPGVEAVKHVAIVMIPCKGDDEKARLEKAISLQYDKDDLAKTKRVDRPDGRVWIVHSRDPQNAQVRMFLPAPHEAIVMCVAFTGGENAQAPIPTLESIFETVRVTK